MNQFNKVQVHISPCYFTKINIGYGYEPGKKYNTGYNHISHKNNCCYHAEVDAFKNTNLKNLRNKNVNLIVLRVNKSRQLCASKPCENCIKFMNKMIIKFKINLKYVYYSTENRILEKVTFESLLNSPDKHLSFSERKKRNLV